MAEFDWDKHEGSYAVFDAENGDIRRLLERLLDSEINLTMEERQHIANSLTGNMGRPAHRKRSKIVETRNTQIAFDIHFFKVFMKLNFDEAYNMVANYHNLSKSSVKQIFLNQKKKNQALWEAQEQVCQFLFEVKMTADLGEKTVGPGALVSLQRALDLISQWQEMAAEFIEISDK